MKVHLYQAIKTKMKVPTIMGVFWRDNKVQLAKTHETHMIFSQTTIYGPNKMMYNSKSLNYDITQRL